MKKGGIKGKRGIKTNKFTFAQSITVDNELAGQEVIWLPDA